MAKDFSKVNTGRSRIQAEIEQAAEVRKPGQQGTAGPEEQRQRAEEMRTSGRKGCHLPRINLAFTPTNYDFVRIVSRIRGESLTAFTNWIIEQYRTEHPDLYKGALELIEMGKTQKEGGGDK